MNEHLRVLIIEAQQDTADTLGDLLHLSGFQIKIAYSGRAGLSTAERFQPDAVICDINMPEVDGFMVAESIRNACWGENTFLIAMTGDSSEETKRKSLISGFDFYLVKPVYPIELYKILYSLKT